MNYTNWYVITGAPSSGKTTLINELEKFGYDVSHEVARAYITQLLLRNDDKLSRNTLHVQRALLKLKLERERQYSAEQCVIFDRGIPDSIAYFRFNGLNAIDAIDASQINRYKKIFFCQNLPVISDGIRIENDAMAHELGELIYQAYQNLGYDIVQLPPVSVAKRMNLILANLS
jgi:predicted ATPase